jgi:hypothetical protein
VFFGRLLAVLADNPARREWALMEIVVGIRRRGRQKNSAPFELHNGHQAYRPGPFFFLAIQEAIWMFTYPADSSISSVLQSFGHD